MYPAATALPPLPTSRMSNGCLRAQMNRLRYARRKKKQEEKTRYALRWIPLSFVFAWRGSEREGAGRNDREMKKKREKRTYTKGK